MRLFGVKAGNPTAGAAASGGTGGGTSAGTQGLDPNDPIVPGAGESYVAVINDKGELTRAMSPTHGLKILPGLEHAGGSQLGIEYVDNSIFHTLRLGNRDAQLVLNSTDNDDMSGAYLQCGAGANAVHETGVFGVQASSVGADFFAAVKEDNKWRRGLVGEGRATVWYFDGSTQLKDTAPGSHIGNTVLEYNGAVGAWTMNARLRFQNTTDPNPVGYSKLFSNLYAKYVDAGNTITGLYAQVGAAAPVLLLSDDPATPGAIGGGGGGATLAGQAKFLTYWDADDSIAAIYNPTSKAGLEFTANINTLTGVNQMGVEMSSGRSDGGLAFGNRTAQTNFYTNNRMGSIKDMVRSGPTGTADSAELLLNASSPDVQLRYQGNTPHTQNRLNLYQNETNAVGEMISGTNAWVKTYYEIDGMTFAVLESSVKIQGGTHVQMTAPHVFLSPSASSYTGLSVREGATYVHLPQSTGIFTVLRHSLTSSANPASMTKVFEVDFDGQTIIRPQQTNTVGLTLIAPVVPTIGLFKITSHSGAQLFTVNATGEAIFHKLTAAPAGVADEVKVYAANDVNGALGLYAQLPTGAAVNLTAPAAGGGGGVTVATASATGNTGFIPVFTGDAEISRFMGGATDGGIKVISNGIDSVAKHEFAINYANSGPNDTTSYYSLGNMQMGMKLETGRDQGENILEIYNAADRNTKYVEQIKVSAFSGGGSTERFTVWEATNGSQQYEQIITTETQYAEWTLHFSNKFGVGVMSGGHALDMVWTSHGRSAGGTATFKFDLVTERGLTAKGVAGHPPVTLEGGFGLSDPLLLAKAGANEVFHLGAKGELVYTPITAAPTPIAGKVVQYVKDNGSGKLAVYAQFPTGAPVLLGVEP